MSMSKALVQVALVLSAGGQLFGCASPREGLATAASLPFALVDGVVMVGTLGMWHPGLMGTVSDAVEGKGVKYEGFCPLCEQTPEQQQSYIATVNRGVSQIAQASGGSTISPMSTATVGGGMTGTTLAQASGAHGAILASNTSEALGVSSTEAADPARSAGAAAGLCPRTLAYLAPRLPQYPDADLQKARSLILETDLREAFRGLLARGYTTATAAQAAFEQAKADEERIPDMELCIRRSTDNPDQVISALRDGTYKFELGGNIMGSCAKAYVLFYMGYVANKEAAVGIACWAQHES